MAGHGQDFAIARIERDNRAGAIAERLLGDLLQVVVNAELNLFAGNGFLKGKLSDLFTDAIYDDAALAVGALQQIVVLLLETEFARKVAWPKPAVARIDLLFADLTHIAHGVRQETSGEVAPPLNGDHFEDGNVGFVRFDKRNIRRRGVRLDDDGLEFGEGFRAGELVFQISQRNAQTIGDGAEMFLHLGHVVAQQQHAEGGAVVHENAAIAVEHAATRRDDRNFTDAVAFGEGGVLIGVNDLQFPEAQQQHADHAHDDIRGHREPRLRQTIVVPKPVRHENPAREESSQDCMFRPNTPDATRVTKNLQRGFRVGPIFIRVRLKIVPSKISSDLGNEKIFRSSRKTAELKLHKAAKSNPTYH